MNVTTIGFPFAAPASQGSAADGSMAATGFAGLLGATPVSAAGGANALGMPPFVVPSLPAQTGAPLLPGLADTAAAALPGDKPAVPMAQLLATAAPVAVTTPVPVGGNPLADAVAKALAKPAPASAVADSAAPDAPAAAEAVPVVADTAETAVVVPTRQGTAAPSQPVATAAKPAKGTAAAPIAPPTEAADAPPEMAAASAPEAPRVVQPVKGDTPPVRSASREDAAPADTPPATEAQATASAQPILIAVAQPLAPAAAPQPLTAQPQPGGKAGVAAARTAKTDTTAAADMPARPTLAAKATPGTGESVAVDAEQGQETGKGGTGQHGFAQQLALADTQRPGAASALPGGSGFAPAAPHAAPAAAAPATAAPALTPVAGEPVLNARPGELGRGLGVEIARSVGAGEDQLRVRLNPAELGRVEVTLAFDRDGRVQATMRAESQHTLDLLRQDAPDLGRALDQAGIRTDSQSFRFESRDGGAGNGSGGGGQSGFQQSRGGSQQFRDEPDPQAPAYRAIRSDGQVDLIA